MTDTKWMAEWKARVAEIRPATGARVEYGHPPDEAGARGVVLACADSRDGWAALVEWEEGSHRRSPEAFGPSSFHVGLVKVIP